MELVIEISVLALPLHCLFPGYSLFFPSFPTRVALFLHPLSFPSFFKPKKKTKEFVYFEM
uniref:Uncharacterized protein n=1 Tax=Rhizophora mucronata TaxID=61149 RepID=A0A2P2QSB0_RHIMU